MEKPEQLTAKAELERWDQILDEYEGKNQIPIQVAPGESSELNEYLTMDRNVIEGLSPDRANSIACRLSQFSFHIQRLQNRELARINWAKRTIKAVIANEVNNYKGYSYDERSAQAIRGNEKALSLSKIEGYAQQRFDRLQYLSRSLTEFATNLKELARDKRGQQYVERNQS